ncbi:MAG: tyrosine--tRNA ligase [Proteobacteria bacterium]|nr:tyrosine--tRNA ligase [Pseudomonadota bacterium]
MREGCVDFYGESELRERLEGALRKKRPLRVKLGLDPSSPDIHLGHGVVLSKLRCFQDLGHTPIFLVGDFTARIGDPSGRKKTRPALDEEAVRANATTYVEQASQFLDVERAEIRFNSEWMGKMSPEDFIVLCSRYTVARLLERDDFARRYKGGEPISVHELLYPLVQAYDSVALEADVELGGSDQTFNLLVGREIQRDYGQAPQAVITHPLLVGVDGSEKMSKSLGNAIGIREAPEEMYGQLMSISDVLMTEYYRILGVRDEEVTALGMEVSSDDDPLGRKHQLAAALVARFHGAAGAERGAEHFRKVVQRKQLPDDLAETTLALDGADEMGLLEILERLSLTQSRGEARRLVSQGAVHVDQTRVADPTLRLGAGSYLLKVGKRRFARLQLRP